MEACPFAHAPSTSKRPAPSGAEASPPLTADDEIRASSTVSADRSSADGVGVVLVNHGSRSATWRGMLLDLHRRASAALLEIPSVTNVRTAFMEYTEPSIATQLEALDESGCRRAVIVPLLLTVSEHSRNDIPVICGLCSDRTAIEALRREGVRRYPVRAETIITPLLDYTKLVRANIRRRIAALTDSGRRDELGVVLVGYGSEQCNDQWERFFSESCSYTERALGVAAATYAWCGHVVRYDGSQITHAIDAMLGGGRISRVAVIPLLVARDEMFQGRIIGSAIRRSAWPERVLYAADSILPEPFVERWIVRAVTQSIRNKAWYPAVADVGQRRDAPRHACC